MAKKDVNNTEEAKETEVLKKIDKKVKSKSSSSKNTKKSTKSTKTIDNKSVDTKKITTKKKTVKKLDTNSDNKINIKNEINEKKEIVQENIINETVEENKINSKSASLLSLDGNFKTIEVIGLVIITCVVSLILGSLITGGVKENKNKSTDDDSLNKIIETYKYIKENYYGEIDEEKMVTEAIEAMVGTLEDPYSTFFDESSAKNFDITLNGKYQGLGVEITNDENGNIKVNKVFENSPAKKAGIQAGDIIVSVNGNSYLGKTTTEFVSIVRDGTETEFVLVIERNKKQISLSIKKDNIVIDSVRSKIFNSNDKKIGYIDIDIFAANTYEQFRTELTNLEKENINSLILDLRDNTGGHLSTAKDMLSLFLDSSHVIYQTETKDKIEKVYSTGKVTKKYDIVILANSASASASEIVIGALKEEYGAKVVGGSTYGKGTVQELHELPTGEKYKFTTKRWLTPKGNWVNGHGITPDYVLYPSEEYIKNPVEENDNILNKALEILK